VQLRKLTLTPLPNRSEEAGYMIIISTTAMRLGPDVSDGIIRAASLHRYWRSPLNYLRRATVKTGGGGWNRTGLQGFAVRWHDKQINEL